MKNKFRISLVVLLALLITSCGDPEPSTRKYFDWNLRGGWVSQNQTSVYTGELLIDSDKILITGYDEFFFDDPQRPFKDLPRGLALTGYSERDTVVTNGHRGHLFIKDPFEDEPIAIPYSYIEMSNYPNGWVYLLRFTFDGRNETLVKVVQ